jgi:hypothetical protein
MLPLRGVGEVNRQNLQPKNEQHHKLTGYSSAGFSTAPVMASSSTPKKRSNLLVTKSLIALSSEVGWSRCSKARKFFMESNNIFCSPGLQRPMNFSSRVRVMVKPGGFSAKRRPYNFQLLVLMPIVLVRMQDAMATHRGADLVFLIRQTLRSL